MAIKYNNAVRTARVLLGTPYSEMDCIRFIVMVIRRTAGGDPSYRCEGTNWLWRSIDNASKYRHLTWRQEGTQGAKPGMLAFKKDGDDIHHVGLVTYEGTVIHSSSVHGMVVETPLDESWHLLAVHKEIAVLDVEPAKENDAGAEVGVPVKQDHTGITNAYTSLVRSDGVSIMLAGDWRVAND